MSIPDALLLQRLRNRVIEYLEFVAEAEHDPPLVKTSDIVNEWVYGHNTDPFPIPPYTEVEAVELWKFVSALERFCDATPDWPETYDGLFAHPAWKPFRDAACTALATLAIRGKLPED